MKNFKKLIRPSSSYLLTPLRQPPKDFGGIISNSKELEHQFLELRPYNNNTNTELLTKFIIKSIVQNQGFVNNSERLMFIAQSLLGRRISGYFIEKTFGRVFTGGSTPEAVKVTINRYNEQGIPCFICYLAESAKSQIPTDQDMDQYAQDFLDSVYIVSEKPNNGIAVKLSPLGNYDLLKKANTAQRLLLSIFEEASKSTNIQNEASLQEIYNVMKQKNPELDQRTYLEFIKQFYGLDVDGLNTHHKISKFDWRLNTHVYDFFDNKKNRNAVIKMFSGFGDKDIKDIEAFKTRFEKILFGAIEKKVEILCDAEQSYLQAFIDSIVGQYAAKYHQQGPPILATTIQNYLKESSEKLKFEIQKCEKLKIPFCIKMVRGAYMVEERRIAQEQGTESPIFDNIEGTHNSYDSNIEYALSRLGNKSLLYICGHNQNSIFRAMELIEKKGIDKKNGGVKFAQQFGFGEHLTHYIHRSGFHVFKFMVYGPTHILFPFLSRRAQESRQMISATKFQRKLLADELKKRIYRTKN